MPFPSPRNRAPVAKDRLLVSTISTLVIVLGVVATIVVISVAVWRAFVRVRAAYQDATRSLQRFKPALEQLERTSAVTRQELERVETAVAQLRHEREARREARRIASEPPESSG